MSTPRRPLAVIDANRPRNNKLSPFTRGAIKALNLNSNSIRGIGKKLQIYPGTVQYTLQQTTRRLNGKTLSRNGRPKVLNARSRALILRIIC
ncbi:hypothetical protein BJY01DRAFT_226970 [Aspergillus pseudoustus]|uniref:Uncharacterized protein n=1 Tax=Aspergillus pseudoustus TaxID=1810923 RepID=A0ABR4IV49_9EURO